MSWHTLKWHTAHYITLLVAGEVGCRRLSLDGQLSHWSYLPSVSLSTQACSTDCPQCSYGPYRITTIGQLRELHTTFTQNYTNQFPHHVETWTEHFLVIKPSFWYFHSVCLRSAMTALTSIKTDTISLITIMRNFNQITSDTAVHMLIWF